MARALAAFACVSCLSACGAAPSAQAVPPAHLPAQPALEPTALETALADAERTWQTRWDPSALARAIGTWRGALALPGASPAALQLRIAEAHHFQGSAIVSRGGEAQAARTAFAAGVEASIAAGAGDPHGAASEALYWWAQNRAAVAAQDGYGASLVAQQDVLSVMRRCAEARCPYDHGGAYRFLGSYHARPLAFPQRDLKQARRYFDQAIALDSAHLLTRVAFARDFAVAAQDRSLFEQQVRFVVEAEAKPASATRGDTQLAQHLAAELLLSAPNLFE